MGAGCCEGALSCCFAALTRPEWLVVAHKCSQATAEDKSLRCHTVAAVARLLTKPSHARKVGRALLNSVHARV